MYKFIISAVLTAISFALPCYAQRTSSAKASKPNTPASSNGPVVIAVEEGKVYVDPLEENVAPGDILVIFKNDTYFIHPVTKERILREATNIAELEVESVFSNYIQTHPKPAMAISMIEPGMLVRKSNVKPTPVVQPEIEPQPIPDTSVETNENYMREIISQANESLSATGEPVEITFDGKTVYYNSYTSDNTKYKLLKKKHEKGKLLSAKDRIIIEKDVIYVLTHKLGYTTERRMWNKNRTEYFTYFNQ